METTQMSNRLVYRHNGILLWGCKKGLTFEICCKLDGTGRHQVMWYKSWKEEWILDNPQWYIER